MAGTEEDIEALEISGNTLVNSCFEAHVKKEKEGRDRRKFGYEAFFFEKFVNRRFFDPAVYQVLIALSSKRLVEQRFNKSLRGFNVKKMQQETGDFEPQLQSSISSLTFEDSNSKLNHREDNNNGSNSSLKRVPSQTDTAGGMKRTSSQNRLIRERNRVQSKRLSARNTMLSDEKKDDQTVTTRSSARTLRISSARLAALKNRNSW